MNELILTGHDLRIEDVERVARDRLPVRLHQDVAQNLAPSHDLVTRFVDEERVVYGVTTGFGRFSDVVIPDGDRGRLQENLIMSHAAGVGVPFTEDISRAMLLLRANALAQGYSGIRLSLLELLVALLNRGVSPVIPSQGSVGASGDLAPLAHLALVLIGQGEAWYQGQRVAGSEALSRAGLSPIKLEAKEGLALINGTQAMSGMGSLAVARATHLADWADMAASLTIEVLRGIPDAFLPQVSQVRPHPGMAVTARHLRMLLEGSLLTTRPGEVRVQDAYSLRCVPQVHGASRDGLDHIGQVITREMNSVTDNPLIFPALGQAVSAGNFHGQPVALVLDYLAIVLAEWANISERRTERLVNPSLSGLPAFLVQQGGLHNGLMLAQYTAASLVSENKVWAHPSSVDSIPTSANQEDHVSMGTTSGRKALMILQNLVRVLAIELICGAQAADLAGVEKLAPKTRQIHQFVREVVPFWDHDRVLSYDLEAMATHLMSLEAEALRQTLLA